MSARFSAIHKKVVIIVENIPETVAENSISVYRIHMPTTRATLLSTPLLPAQSSFAALAIAALSAAILTACQSTTASHSAPNVAIKSSDTPTRKLQIPPAAPGQGWGVCYGPHRDGQAPKSPNQPTKTDIREDLHIIAKHWRMVRMYGQGNATRFAAEVIREDRLPLKLFSGIWIAPEVQLNDQGTVIARDESLAALNRDEVAQGIRLANDFPDVVMALGVGNETQVTWSSYRTTSEVLKKYINQVRSSVKQPVTTCDDYNFWNKPESKQIADSCDFIALHAYAMWNKQQLPDALPWTREQIQVVKTIHTNRDIVLTELGWATQKGTNGYQAIGIVADANERNQEVFCRALENWAFSANQPYFLFEAFDEKWKGGDEPNEVEKHWGAFFSDRTPKLFMQASHASESAPKSH